MVELIISEKPKSAQRIAEALADGKPIRKGTKQVGYYEITRGNQDIIVASTVGHIYGVAEKVGKGKKKSFNYPTFDVEWKPIFEVDKDAAYTKKYFSVLEKVSKMADTFTVACDYDVEGSVIGMNIIRYLCKQKDARRMKFSTLTKPDLIEAYDNISPKLDWDQAIAGETRHNLDFFYGINLSRALISSIQKAGMFKLLSIGRVQGPALHMVVEKEREIQAFKADPYWELELTGSVKNNEVIALHTTDKFWKKAEADKIFKKVNGKDGSISEVKKREISQAPPTPFDLTTLQTEAYRHFSINPKMTLSIAQELYTSGLISYPRTSSQQLPVNIGYDKIIKNLQKKADYKELCVKLLKKPLKPNNGKKSDPAHPAIYPTGIVRKLEGPSAKIYDLIARRFLATFAEPAKRETMTVKIDIESELFSTSGTHTTYPGWHEFYGPYAKAKDEELPEMKEGDSVKQKKLEQLEKETKPPARYTQASIIRELEKRNIGTKATRAEVVDTLFRRGYVIDKAIRATDFGMEIYDVLQKYSPEIVDEELTRHFEEQMEKLHEGKITEEEILQEAETVLTKLLTKWKKQEKEVGTELIKSLKEFEAKENTVGACHSCKGMLMMKRGKFGRFIACTNYPKCEVTFKLPQNGLIKPTDQMCETCTFPMVMVIKKRARPQTVCINLDCKTKETKLDQSKVDTVCEKCGKGKLVIRRSVYGHFLACDAFPKCRNILKNPAQIEALKEQAIKEKAEKEASKSI